MKYHNRFTDNVSQADFSGKHLFVGFDMHKRNWVVTVSTKDLQLKTFSMDPFPEALETLLSRVYGIGVRGFKQVPDFMLFTKSQILNPKSCFIAV